MRLDSNKSFEIADVTEISVNQNKILTTVFLRREGD